MGLVDERLRCLVDVLVDGDLMRLRVYILSLFLS